MPAQVQAIEAHATSTDARVAQQEAVVAQARLNLEYATVKAPVAGMVSRKTVEIGQIVQPGQPLMAVVPLDQVWVTANFKETQLDAMRPGQPVSFRIDASIEDRSTKRTLCMGALSAERSLSNRGLLTATMTG